jgi:ketosteroid isomerase-like protein
VSAENAQLVERLYDWLAAGDGGRAFDVYDAEIEWDTSNAPWLLELGSHLVYHGHEGVRRARLRSGRAAWLLADRLGPCAGGVRLG